MPDPATSSRRLTLKSAYPRIPGYPEDLRQRAEDVVNGTNLVEVVLYGHLLLEQALEILIRERLTRRDVLEGGRFARLSFAQKVTIYVGLYGPDEDQIHRLLGFNRIRKRMAHSFADLEAEILRVFSGEPGQSAIQRVQFAFFFLIHAELGVVHGARRLDLDDPASAPIPDGAGADSNATNQ